MKKVYIAGKIVGQDNYMELFKEAEDKLKAEGYAVMNPTVLPKGFEWNEYMEICLAILDVCDGIFMLENWRNSNGAIIELEYAVRNNKWIKYQYSHV